MARDHERSGMEQETPGAAIGRRVRHLRDHGLWTRSELAERTGLSRQAIANLELGTSDRPRRGTIEKLARALGVDIETLLGGVGDEAPKAEASRPEEAFRIVGRIVEDENGDQWFRWAVKWNATPAERGQYREIIVQLISGADYDEEELTPEEARVLMAGAV
jgi:transcriptional regulator with XRE-family HTH domain